MQDNPTPQIQRISLEEVILRVRSLDRNKMFGIEEFLQKLIDPPSPQCISTGIKALQLLGGIDKDENLTNLGKYISDIPLHPNYAKLLLYSIMFKCFTPIIRLISLLTCGDIFKIPRKEKHRKEVREFRKELANGYMNDYLMLLNLHNQICNLLPSELRNYCKKRRLNYDKLLLADKLERQIESYVFKTKIISESDIELINTFSTDINYITAIITSCFPDQIALKSPNNPIFVYNNTAGGYIHPSSCIVVDDYKSSEDTCVLLFNEVTSGSKMKIYYKNVAMINPLPLFLFSMDETDDEKIDRSLISHIQ